MQKIFIQCLGWYIYKGMRTMDKDLKYGFPLCIQLVPPENIFENKEFAETLSLLRDKGFYGVELNITDFSGTAPDRLKAYLKAFNLKMTYLASGSYAKKNKLSLSSADESQRKKTIDQFEQMICFAEQMECGIICGFIKGEAGEDEQKAVIQLQRSLMELEEKYGDKRVDILLEATNHYEATVLNTVGEAAQVAGLGMKNIEILPDTYHMNIEDLSMAEAMIQYASYYKNIHISDNNRYFPGFGAIDFFQIMQILRGIGYNGTISIEGRNYYSLNEDIERSSAYLAEVGARLQYREKGML